MNIQSLINQVKVINEKYETIKKINGENFNIFSILNLERKEVDTHSYFIYDLLNPKGSHNQGDIFLQIFLKKILKKKEYKKIGSILEDEVEREKRITDNKRIDFTIETSKFFIAIEMKIDASDQDKQLYDYYKYVKQQGKDFKLFYLTLDGKEANDDSTNGLKVNEDYFLLSFEYDIYNWIEACIEKTATIPTIREGLVHYRNLIQKLTNQMGDKMDKEMIYIIKTPTDIESMYTIYNKYANVLANKEAEFWESLYCKIKHNKFDISFLTDPDNGVSSYQKDYKAIAQQRKKKNDYFGLNLSRETNGVTFDIDLYSYNNDDKLILNIQISKDDTRIELSKIKEQLERIGFIKKNKEYQRWFYLKEKIKFYGNGKPTFELFDDKKFEELVESTANEVIKTLNKILKYEKELLKDF